MDANHKTPPIIEPSNGRIVWFTPHRDSAVLQHDETKPLAAMIVHVWHDRMVNLAVWDSNGYQQTFTSVPLLQGDDLKPEHGFFASWMPYQKGQAAKTDALEKQLKG